jgi:hypothetical protein
VHVDVGLDRRQLHAAAIATTITAATVTTAAVTATIVTATAGATATAVTAPITWHGLATRGPSHYRYKRHHQGAHPQNLRHQNVS